MGGSSSVPKSSNTGKEREMDSKECEIYEAACKEEYERQNKLLTEIDESIKANPSQANLLRNFSKALSFTGNNFEALGNIVSNIKSQWDVIESKLTPVKELIGDKEVNTVKSLRGKYFSLLLETSCVVDELCAGGRIQKRNVTRMLNILKNERYQEAGCVKLSAKDGHTFGASTKILSKWIDQTQLESVIKKWQEMTAQLEQSKSNIQKAVENLGEKYERMSSWKKFFVALGALVAVAAVVGLAIATCGAGAAIAAGTVSAVKIAGISFATSHLIAAGIGIAVGGIVVGSAIGCSKLVTRRYKTVNQIINMLHSMAQTGYAMQKELDALKHETNAIKRELLTPIEISDHDLTILKDSLEEISKYLDCYDTQGQKVVKLIKKECCHFINKKI